ncbi:VanZ family protein [Nocardiopsis sp. NPDC006832]|uniref:VanZ family protein n=1 Tax=Nocardiopsis sp. NPDC006832 TaxID=3157188 RepID=UPI0033F330AF
MWTVLFYVNPLTTTLALALGLVVALFLAGRRPAMRAMTLCLSALYLLVLTAPLSGLGAIGESDRHVIWDPRASFQDIGVPKGPENFGVTLDDGRVIHYSPTEPTTTERAEKAEVEDPASEVLHVYEGPDGALAVIDAEGTPVEPESEAERIAVETIERELEFMDAQVARYEEEGPWSVTGGLALQERVLNTLLFVPIGIAAFFAFSSWSARLLFGPALSSTIETTQWVLAADRLPDTGDLLVNGVGSLFGTLFALTAVGLVEVFDRRPRARAPLRDASTSDRALGSLPRAASLPLPLARFRSRFEHTDSSTWDDKNDGIDSPL